MSPLTRSLVLDGVVYVPEFFVLAAARCPRVYSRYILFKSVIRFQIGSLIWLALGFLQEAVSDSMSSREQNGRSIYTKRKKKSAIKAPPSRACTREKSSRETKEPSDESRIGGISRALQPAGCLLSMYGRIGPGFAWVLQAKPILLCQRFHGGPGCGVFHSTLTRLNMVATVRAWPLSEFS